MKLKTVLIIILIFVINLMFFNMHIVKATDSDVSSVFEGGDQFLSAGKGGTYKVNQNELKKASDTVYNILLFAGIAVSAIMISVLGIKFMIGSAEEKAQVKDTLVPFIIGCIVVFGAFGIWRIFIIIGNNM